MASRELLLVPRCDSAPGAAHWPEDACGYSCQPSRVQAVTCPGCWTPRTHAVLARGYARRVTGGRPRVKISTIDPSTKIRTVRGGRDRGSCVTRCCTDPSSSRSDAVPASGPSSTSNALAVMGVCVSMTSPRSSASSGAGLATRRPPSSDSSRANVSAPAQAAASMSACERPCSRPSPTAACGRPGGGLEARSSTGRRRASPPPPA